MDYKMNFRKPTLGNCTPTSCPKAGVKIHETPYTNNKNTKQYNQPSFVNNQSKLEKPINFYNTSINNLDLDLDHYSLNDLYNLFNISNKELTDTILKDAKQIVLKIHPDKSKLDAKYFLFFSSAYKRLYSIYEFQNKSTNKKLNNDDYYDEDKRNLLDNIFETNKAFKDPKNFNKWFNESFEKHRLENPNETDGYGDWLKGDEGIMNIQENVTRGNMNEIIEQKKKQIQAVSVYNGITDSTFSSQFGGTLLSDSNNSFTTDNYTDLRQAYTETLIPISNEDYERMPKFKNVNEYKKHRDYTDTTPLTEADALRILQKDKNNLEQDSAALAFKYAQEYEKVKQKQQSFWGDIMRLTN
jgi:hypothetical protein